MSIADAHSLDPEKIKFIKPLVKDEAAFGKLAEGTEILVMGTVIKKTEKTEEEIYMESLNPAEKLRLKMCLDTDNDFMGWDHKNYPSMREYMAWIFLTYAMPDLKRFLVARGHEGGRYNYWMKEYLYICKKMETDIHEVRNPNFFSIELMWHYYRAYAKIALLQRIHPSELVFDWRKILALKYNHPLRNTKSVSNIFGFHHQRHIENLTTPHYKKSVPDVSPYYPNGVMTFTEGYFTLKLEEPMIKGRIVKSLLDPEQKANSIFGRRSDMRHFLKEMYLEFDTQFMGLCDPLVGYLIFKLDRWSGV